MCDRLGASLEGQVMRELLQYSHSRVLPEHGMRHQGDQPEGMSVSHPAEISSKGFSRRDQPHRCYAGRFVGYSLMHISLSRGAPRSLLPPTGGYTIPGSSSSFQFLTREKLEPHPCGLSGKIVLWFQAYHLYRWVEKAENVRTMLSPSGPACI